MNSTMLILNILESFKRFLGENTTLAFLAISVVLNLSFLRLLLREKDAHRDTILAWLPLMSEVSALLGAAVNRAKTIRATPKESK